MTMSVMLLRRLPECQRWLLDVADDVVSGWFDAMERLGETGVLSGWSPVSLERFPDTGRATSRFGYMAGTQSVLVYPAELGAEFAAAAPGFVVLPVDGPSGLAMVPGSRGVARGSDDELFPVFRTWPPLEVELDFEPAAIPRGRFFALSAGRRDPEGLFVAVEERVAPPPLYRWLVDDPASGWSATEVWTSVGGPVPFWR